MIDLFRRQYTKILSILVILLFAQLLVACSGSTWNNPYPAHESGKNIMYSSFAERPKHLDPVRSYSSNEYAFIGQIYEPPLQYHFLKRPYVLEPLTATEVPKPVLLGKDGKKLDKRAFVEDIAYSVYRIKIKPGIQYQPHPAFARGESGDFLYHNLTTDQMAHIHTLDDFKTVSHREVTAADYVYQMKRMAQPSLHSPIFGIMAEYIVGLKALSKKIKKTEDEIRDKGGSQFVDLNKFELSGVTIIDRYTYEIKIKGLYPQLVYWLAMPFFAPMPEEAVRFYAQPGLKEKNISLDWYPVGTGAYMLTKNNPNREMVMEKNPNYRDVYYPSVGATGDTEASFLSDAGKKLPFIDKVVYKLEKETIPYWNKFLQGYYDTSGISSESFDQAIQFSGSGEVQLTDEMKRKGIQLTTAIAASTYYLGFNMRDPVVGGLSERAKKLRQAISIAIDYEEYISIFANGRGVPAQGPIPPGIFGYVGGKQGINPVVYDWKKGRPQRKSIAYAKQLLRDAGYPNGIDEKTGKQLVLYYDNTATGPGSKAMLSWYRKQFKKIDIQLNLRSTMYNRFQDKMRKGTAQIFSWGWNADYPDPENFLFLLYGPNSKVDVNGENAANYKNPEFDRLFEKMKNMANGQRRKKVINKMIRILREDAPWVWGFNPKQFSLSHGWYMNAKPNLMAHNTLQYKRIDAIAREKKRIAWNKPVLWPIIILALFFIGTAIPAILTYRQREHIALKNLAEEGR